MIKQTIEEFCEDAFLTLKAENERIYKAFTVGPNAEFNAPEWKGLGLFSTTEPVLKYILYTNLAYKYRMWSESTFGYEKMPTKRYLDLALNLSGDESDEFIKPDTAIEMKWAGVKKDGGFNKVSQSRIINDLSKLVKNSIKNKYFMQFLIVKKGILSSAQLTDINTYIDNRTVKVIGNPIQYNFEIDSGDSKNDYAFYFITWKVAKRNEQHI